MTPATHEDLQSLVNLIIGALGALGGIIAAAVGLAGFVYKRKRDHEEAQLAATNKIVEQTRFLESLSSSNKQNTEDLREIRTAADAHYETDEKQFAELNRKSDKLDRDMTVVHRKLGIERT